MTFKTGSDLTEEARQRITEVSVRDVQQMLERGDDVVYLDVREPNEWNLGHLPKATLLPRGNLESKIEGMVPREKKIVVYCARANRSALAADTLVTMGYDAVSMGGGWLAWIDGGGEVEG